MHSQRIRFAWCPSLMKVSQEEARAECMCLLRTCFEQLCVVWSFWSTPCLAIQSYTVNGKAETLQVRDLDHCPRTAFAPASSLLYPPWVAVELHLPPQVGCPMRSIEQEWASPRQHVPVSIIQVQLTEERWMSLTVVLQLHFLDLDDLHRYLLLAIGTKSRYRRGSNDLGCKMAVTEIKSFSALFARSKQAHSSSSTAALCHLHRMWKCEWHEQTTGQQWELETHISTCISECDVDERIKRDRNTSITDILAIQAAVQIVATGQKSVSELFKRLSRDGKGNRGIVEVAVCSLNQYLCILGIGHK